MRVKRSNDIPPSHWSSIALLTSPTVAETRREPHKHTDKHWTWKQSLHLTATHHQGSSRTTSAAMRLTATRGSFCKLPQQQLTGQREGERKTSKTKQIDAKWLCLACYVKWWMACWGGCRWTDGARGRLPLFSSQWLFHWFVSSHVLSGEWWPLKG